MNEGGLHLLLTRAAEGDDRARERAMVELVRLLSIFVRAGMGRRLRDHRESADVCQSIARSFIEDLGTGGTGHLRFENEAAVVGYLKTVVRSKLAMLARHDGAAKRDGNVVGGAVALGSQSGGGGSGDLGSEGGAGGGHGRGALSTSAGPAGGVPSQQGAGPGDHGSDEAGDGERALREREAMSLVLERLSEDEQELVRLRLGGLEWDEIGVRLGRAPSALRKQWSRMVERVGGELDDSED